jgi:exosortase D (VPLPA-CTERM-specific)
MLKRDIDLKYSWLSIAVSFVCMIYSYWEILTPLYQTWSSNEDYSHSLLIPFISIYLIWDKRKQIKQTEFRTDFRFFPLVLIPFCIFVLGKLAADVNSIRISFFIMVFMSVWFLYGTKLLKTLFFPLVLLFLMIPLPGFVYSQVTFQLQLLSSKYSVELLHLLGVDVYREGNVIDMGFSQFQVVEACNGLRFILPLLTVCILFAFFKKLAFWKRAVLVLISIPIAIAANIIRIAGTGILAGQFGPEVAEGFFHSFSGWLVFMIGFAVVFCLYLLLKKLPEKRGIEKHIMRENRSNKYNINFLAFGFLAVVILITPAAANIIGHVEPKKLEVSVKEFPHAVNEWDGQQSYMDDATWEYVGGQDYVQIDYFKPGELPVNFYVAYYELQNQGAKFFHSPKLCLPGAGWHIDRSEVRKIKMPVDGASSRKTLKFNEMILSKGESRQIVYYWYQGRGRNYTSEYTSKFLMAWDGLTRGRTDGALVRLVRTIKEENDIEHARQILDGFAAFTSEELERFLPS